MPPETAPHRSSSRLAGHHYVSMAGPLIARWLVIGLAASWSRGQVPTGGGTITPREQQLWDQVVTFSRLAPATQPYEVWFEGARRQREALLARLREYLLLYPGGAYRDDALRLELQTLFELGTLHNGTLEPLCRRTEEILRSPPSESALHEAAYWAIICGRCSGPQTASRPATRPAATVDPELLLAYREYLARYPRSRHVPRLAGLIFQEAARHDDRAQMADILAHLRRHFPDHLVTATLEGVWRRTTAVGQPFWPELRTLDGRLVQRGDYLGHPVLIVVWAGFDEQARHCAQAVERFRAAHPSVRVIGVGLDPTAAGTLAAARELELAWPQCNDELGWGGLFVRTWGIDQIPFVLVIDPTGRLVGCGGADVWERLACQVLGQNAATLKAR